MSVKIMGKVWELELPHNKLIVLLAMADHADHEGKNVFPSQGLIAWKTGYSVRQIRSIVIELVKDGILKEVSRQGGKATKYEIDLRTAKQKAPYTPEKTSARKKLPPGSNDFRPTPEISADDLGKNSLKTADEPLTIIKPSVAHSDEQPLKLVDKPTVRNEWYEAVKTVWGYEAGRNGAVVKWLTGKESETEFNKYPIQPPMSPTELLEWSKDYKSLHEFMIEKPYKVQESIIKWRRYKTEKPAQEAAAAKRRADIEAAQRISTMIATGNYDALDETEAAS